MTCRILIAIFQRTVVPCPQIGTSQCLPQLGYKKSTRRLLQALYRHRFCPLDCWASYLHFIQSPRSFSRLCNTDPSLPKLQLTSLWPRYSLKTCKFVLLYPNLISRSCPCIRCAQSEPLHENMLNFRMCVHHYGANLF